MQQQQDELKNVSEESKQSLREIHTKLEKQSKYYRTRASITLGLIILVTIAGLLIFAFPSLLFHGNSSRDNKLIFELIQDQKSKNTLFQK
jgi:hypothetical protein